MADKEHLKILDQGVEAWNQWRRQNPPFVPDLSEADLSHKHLMRANLYTARLSKSNLSDAILFGAQVTAADLSGADLSGANLVIANLSFSDLSNATLTKAQLAETSFGDTDLSNVKGLDTCKHSGPSIIDFRTLQRSGMLPEVFLRGCGLPDEFITYLPSFLNQPIQFYSCFISYSSKDDAFARRLHADLQANNVRCWFAPEDLKIGDKIRHEIDQSIRLHDKLLLVLSEHSIASDWVEAEVESCFEKEAQRKETVLFPIRLDDAVMKTEKAWAANIRRTRHIGDFSNWKDHDAYQEAFQRVLRDLKPHKKK